MKNTLLIAAATATLLTAVNTASAEEPLLSPRAKANQSKHISSGDSGPNLVSGNYLGAGAKSAANQSKMASGAGSSPNLVSGNYAGAAAKNPIRDLRSAEKEIQVAPLK
jgi:hypothetical protein